MRTTITLATAVFVLALATWAQKLKIEPDQRYLLLATTKTSTMQEELDEAAGQGFRIAAGSPTSANEMVLLLVSIGGRNAILVSLAAR